MVEGEGRGQKKAEGENPAGTEHSEPLDPRLVQGAIPDTGGIAGDEEGDQQDAVNMGLFDTRLFLRAFAQASRLTIDEEGFYEVSSKDEAELADLILDLRQKRDNIDARKRYGLRLFVVVVAWLFLVLATVWAVAIDIRAPDWYPNLLPLVTSVELSDAVLIALISTTTANVLGLLAIVLWYLFPRSPS